MGLNRHPVEVAVRDWLLRVWTSAVAVVYSPLAAPNVGRPPRPFATIRLLPLAPLGAASGERVYRTNADDENLVDVDLRTFSEATVSLQVYADNGEELILRLRASLADPAELLASERAGLNVLEVGPDIDTSFEEGGEWIRRRTLDVVVAYASHYSTTTSAIGTVETTDDLSE
jgi:hypothetical protein